MIERKLLNLESSDYLDVDVRYTPDDLRQTADAMDRDGVISVLIEEDPWGNEPCDIFIERYESQEEAEARFQAEQDILRRNEESRKRKEQQSLKSKKAQEKAVVTQARKLGMVFPGE